MSDHNSFDLFAINATLEPSGVCAQLKRILKTQPELMLRGAA